LGEVRSGLWPFRQGLVWPGPAGVMACSAPGLGDRAGRRRPDGLAADMFVGQRGLIECFGRAGGMKYNSLRGVQELWQRNFVVFA
jgi:hypothetical protein